MIPGEEQAQSPAPFSVGSLKTGKASQSQRWVFLAPGNKQNSVHAISSHQLKKNGISVHKFTSSSTIQVIYNYKEKNIHHQEFARENDGRFIK